MIETLNRLYTREFVPDFYEREIFSIINGDGVYPSGADPLECKLININVRASNLHVSSTSDPLCCLERESPRGWREYARTEVCWNNSNPIWIRPFTVGFEPNGTELLLFEVYDIVSNSELLETQKLIGSCELDLNVLLSAPKNSVTLDIVSPHSSDDVGNLHISYQFVNPKVFGSIVFKSWLTNIISNSYFHKISPYFEISRLDALTQEFIPFYKSAVSKGFHWDSVELPLQLFGSLNDQQEIIRISLFDFILQGPDKFLGFYDTTIGQFLDPSVDEFDIVNSQGIRTCLFHCQMLVKIERPRYEDYKIKGVKLSTMLAIDFSSSKVSMMRTNKVNHIENGVFSYGNLISDLCKDLHMLSSSSPISGYAFADFRGEKVIPLRLNNNSAQFTSIKTLLKAYGMIRDNVSYPKEAPLAPVIRKARSMANERWEKHKMVTLIIVLTNGLFTDLQEAVDELVEAENEPICVVMALLGGARRELETIFNPKKNLLQHSNGRTAKRLMATLINYEKNCLYADLSLEARLAPSIKRMATEFIEHSDFHPF